MSTAGASFEVLDADDTPLAELYSASSTSPEPESSSVNSAGMQSMASNATGDGTDAVCSKTAFLLPLQLGQNDYSIVVTAPDLADQVSHQGLCSLPSPCHSSTVTFAILHKVDSVLLPIGHLANDKLCACLFNCTQHRVDTAYIIRGL